MATRRVWWSFCILVIAGCKSAGTITLDFELAGSGACAATSGDSFVLYAEPRTSCSDCACGGCAGREPDQWLACAACSATSLSGTSLPLEPGLWAVVLEEYTADSPPVLRRSQCIDIKVDSDGTADVDTATADHHCMTCY